MNRDGDLYNSKNELSSAQEGGPGGTLYKNPANYPPSSAGSVCSASLKSRDSPKFAPFTRDSLDRLNERTSTLIKEKGCVPKRTPTIEDGGVLPRAMEPFPLEMYGQPLEEIDQFLLEEVSIQTD